MRRDTSRESRQRATNFKGLRRQRTKSRASSLNHYPRIAGYNEPLRVIVWNLIQIIRSLHLFLCNLLFSSLLTLREFPIARQCLAPKESKRTASFLLPDRCRHQSVWSPSGLGVCLLWSSHWLWGIDYEYRRTRTTTEPFAPRNLSALLDLFLGWSFATNWSPLSFISKSQFISSCQRYSVGTFSSFLTHNTQTLRIFLPRTAPCVYSLACVQPVDHQPKRKRLQ